jgi:hypothetical protein
LPREIRLPSVLLAPRHARSKGGDG